MDISAISESIKSEIKIDADGKGTLSLQGACALLGIGTYQLAHHCMDVELKQNLIAYGFDPASFAEEGLPEGALSIVVCYFAYEAKQTKKQAMVVAMFLATRGSRVALQNIVGWQATPAELPKLDQKRQGCYKKAKALADCGMTYREYCDDRGVTLNRSQQSDFVTRLSAWCKANDRTPERICRKNQYYNVYDSKHFPFMDALLQEVLEKDYKPARKTEQMFSAAI